MTTKEVLFEIISDLDKLYKDCPTENIYNKLDVRKGILDSQAVVIKRLKNLLNQNHERTQST